MTSRSERAQHTRDAMIQAGLRLAETTGLAGMSVNLVVKEAGVAKGSFFHHFGDRAGYLLALHRSFHDKLLTDTLQASTALPPGPERVWVAAVAYLDGCLRTKGVRALLLEAPALPSIAGEIRKRNNHLAALLEPQFAVMGWPHPMESARLWIGLVVEAALIEFDASGRQPVLRDALRRFLGLRGRSPPRHPPNRADSASGVGFLSIPDYTDANPTRKGTVTPSAATGTRLRRSLAHDLTPRTTLPADSWPDQRSRPRAARDGRPHDRPPGT